MLSPAPEKVVLPCKENYAFGGGREIGLVAVQEGKSVKHTFAKERGDGWRTYF